MKYIIVGLHGSGKQEIMDTLIKDGVSCGKLFTNADLADSRYDFFTDSDIRDIFENKAYIFIKEVNDSGSIFEGLSFYEFDNNQVFFLTPDQFLSIPLVPLRDKVCLIWLDNTKSNRMARYEDERRSYNFNNEEEVETKFMGDFVKHFYNFPLSSVLYFSNEDPQRVAGIVEAMVKYSDLVEVFSKKFN